MVATSSRVQSRGYLRDCQLFWNAEISHIFNTAVFFWLKSALLLVVILACLIQPVSPQWCMEVLYPHQQ